MIRPENLLSFPYGYLAGPVSLEQLKQNPPVGNCRLAVQDYYYRRHGLYIGKEDIVLPEALKNKGTIVKEFQQDADEFFADLQAGDIVYAEKLRDSQGRKFSVSKQRSLTEDERMRNFHLGVYLKKQSIWHASFIAGGTALWSIDRFCYYYQPVLARRLLIGG